MSILVDGVPIDVLQIPEYNKICPEFFRKSGFRSHEMRGNIMKQFRSSHPGRDLLSGIIVALVSIPISMGYAQIAGLPVVYGLYGSLLPILAFSLITTSPQFVVGVDAMPAVMVGSLLAQFGIAAESDAAMQLVPLMSILTALWFLVFFLLKAGRIVKYISTPVMGGFISGVGLTIILMQVPKLFGGTAGTGELFALLSHIAGQLPSFHLLSAVLGFGTFAIILLCKKWIPKVPMAVVMMVVGAGLQAVFHLDRYGVKMLAAVAPGLPKLMLPGFSYFGVYGEDLIVESLSIAAVVMAQTLLASGSYAMKYGDKLDNNRELLAYSAMNLASGFTGCCPINGSVSRSGIADSFGCRSQLMSLSAFATMLLVLLVGTPMLRYLPVPILTGIVMTALWGILDFHLAKKLWKTSRNELFIFLIAFLGVLIFGTVYGVMIGVVLSFFEVAISAVSPPAACMGVIPGQAGFYPLERNRDALALQNAVIYRFSGNLFFANIDRFRSDIEAAITEDTRAVIVDARGIGRIDLTAAERLLLLNQSLRSKGISFYLTEHDGSLNDQLEQLDAGVLLREGAVRRTIALALEDAEIHPPYPLVGSISVEAARTNAQMEQLVEFEWLFGSDAESVMEQLASESMDQILESDNALNAEEDVLHGRHLHGSWHRMAPGDAERFLDHLEMHFEEQLKTGRLTEEEIARMVHRAEVHRETIEAHLAQRNPELLTRVRARTKQHQKHFEERNPAAYHHLMQLKEQEHMDEPGRKI